MGERSRARSRSGFRHVRRLRRDHRGVVAVVGTLLALLVFFALFGIFLTEYLPLWMEENESQLTFSLQTSLATLKSGVDDQYIFGAIPSYSVPFTTSSNSVPLLAQPTVATLSFLSGCPDGFTTAGAPEKIGSCDFEKVAYATAKGTGSASQTHNYTQTEATNYLEVSVPNRYYTPVVYFFESDAVTASQTNGHAWIGVPPPFNLTKTGTNLTVRTSLLTFVGNASSFTGVGSKDVTSHFLYQTNVTSVGRFLNKTSAVRSFNLTLTLGVHNVCSWYTYLDTQTDEVLGASTATTWTIAATGANGAVLQTTNSSATNATVCISSLSTTYDVTLTLYSVSFATNAIAQATLAFNEGGL